MFMYQSMYSAGITFVTKTRKILLTEHGASALHVHVRQDALCFAAKVKKLFWSRWCVTRDKTFAFPPNLLGPYHQSSHKDLTPPPGENVTPTAIDDASPS